MVTGNSPIITVIIPVYNVEKYLRKCLDSVINQTYTNLEIICVDDGSSDNSGAILDEYAQKDSRIIVIHQGNAGVSAARNKGLDMATGEYIAFVDSDDWLESECYEAAINAFQNDTTIDLVQWFANVINTRKASEKEYQNIKNWHKPKFAGKTTLTPFIISKMLYSPCCNLFKADIIKSLNLRFLNYEVAEDVLFISMYNSKVNNVYFINEALYNYILTETSAMKKYTDNPLALLEKHINCTIECFKFYNKLNQDILFNTVIFHKFKSNILWDLNFIQFDIKTCELLKTFVSQLPQNFYWGEEIKYIRENKFYKIKQCKLPQKSFGNNILGLKIYSIKNPYIKIILFGIKLNIHYQKIFSIKNINETHKMINILGIRIKIKKNKKTKNINNNFETDKKLTLNQLKDFIFNETFLANVIQNTHSKTFAQFKNCNTGKDIVIVASGPTMFYYSPIEDAVHIGVNKVYQDKKLKIDYLFAQDYGAVKPYLSEFLEYPCTKFLGDYMFHSATIDKCIIPQNYRNAKDTYTYYSSYPKQFLYPDIANFPLLDLGTIVFPAIHFAFYTNPKRIYLVGCDCSNAGYFDKTQQRYSSEHLVEKWKTIKKFRDIYYPDIEIISINPVGLKGMFKDIYTEEYLNQVNKEINDENSSYSCV